MKTAYDKPLVWTALVTPFKTDGSIDYPTLQTLAKQQNEAGNGLLALGTTGESFALSQTEKKNVIDTLIQAVPDAALMVGATGMNLENTLEWVCFLNTLPIDAILVALPPYIKPMKEGQKAWFEVILSTSDKPVMFYNQPARVGTKIDPDVIAHFDDHPNFYGLKQSADAATTYEEVLKKGALYCGDDDDLPAYQHTSAVTGLVSVLANVWPYAVHDYAQNALKGQCVLNKDFMQVFGQATNPLAVKYALHQKMPGFRFRARPPLHEKDVSPALRKQIDQLIQKGFTAFVTKTSA